jgi:hypothetical protein
MACTIRLRTMFLLLATLVVLSCGMRAQSASAANSLSACFTVQGQAIPISLAGLEATDRYGRWVPIDSAKLTQSNGCVDYALWGKYTHYNLRVVAAGVTPDQQGLILGVSRYYAPGAYAGRYNLWTSETTVIRGSIFNSWVSGMSNGSSSSNPALLVAGYSDYLGPSLHGSVLCPRSVSNDYDCDGASDNRDNHWKDFRYQ